MKMEMLHDGLVLGVSRWTAPRGNAKGGKLYFLDENSGTNPDLIGLELITPNMPFEMFDQFREKNLPAFYQVLLGAQRGSQNNDAEYVKSAAGKGDADISRLAEFFRVVSGSSPKASVNPIPQPGVLTGLCVSASRYDMEEDGGQKGGSLYFVQPSVSENTNWLGFEVLKVKIPYDLFDLLAEKGLPGEYQFTARLSRRGGDKSRLLVTGIISENLLTRSRLDELFKAPPVSGSPEKPEKRSASEAASKSAGAQVSI
jgi:hypothetical protein